VQPRAQPKALQEHVVVCIDRSGSMGTPFNEVTLEVVAKARNQRTRMEAVKAMFYAFRDRVEVVGRGTHEMGLVQFDNEIERLLELTPRLDRFEAIVDDVEKRGQTAIYSAIVEAASMLQGCFAPESQTDLRIVVLTDGRSNTGVSPSQALTAAQTIGAVVDAIIVGDTPDSNLRKIVNATGGECYQINNLGDGFELLEAESVVSLLARRDGADKPKFTPPARCDFDTLAEKSVTQTAQVKSSSGVSEDLKKQAVVSVDKLKDDAGASGSGQRSAPSLKRILAELKKASSGDVSEGVHLFPAPDNLSFWRVLMEGPEDTPFAGGVFLLNVVIPEAYPLKPPKITFETPVYHCNVSDSGGLCLDILQDSWTPALTIPKCLEAVRMMIKNPNTNDALRQWIAELTIAHQATGGKDGRYYEKAKEQTVAHASKTIEAWKQEWGC
jgi:ubiquitin-protein ligase/Mg-chelatase subunit ChlD